MAAPFVSGAVALMLQANPNLTPNLIKGIFEFTAISKPGVSPLRQGAGFMNVSHAIALAELASHPSSVKRMPIPATWAKHILWGNYMLTGGVLDPRANAWKLGVEWGWAKTKADDGDNIVWGTMNDGDNIVWGTANDGDNIVWGTANDGDNIVWGTANDGDNIVWGTDCGGADCDNIVWGTVGRRQHRLGHRERWRQHRVGHLGRRQHRLGHADDGDNIVWGTTLHLNLTNLVWPILKGGK